MSNWDERKICCDAVPNGDPAIVFARGLVLLVAELERTRTQAAHSFAPLGN